MILLLYIGNQESHDDPTIIDNFIMDEPQPDPSQNV